MIPVTISPVNPNAPSVLPNIGNLASVSQNAPQVPPAVSSLPPGTLLTGFVLNRGAGGQPVLRSDFGDFLLQSSAFLKIGSEVTIRIRASGANFQANIIEIDGKPVSGDAANNSNRNAASGAEGKQVTAQVGAASGSDRLDSIQQSQLLPTTDKLGNVQGQYSLGAVLLNPTPDAAKLQLGQGTKLLLQLFNLQLPSGTSAATTSNASSQPTPSANPQAGQAGQGLGASAATPQTGAAPLSADAPTVSGSTTQQVTKVTQHYQQYQPSQPAVNNAATAMPSQASGGTQAAVQNVHTLTVIGHEQDGDPIVQTPFGLSKITSGVRLPNGATLQAQIALNPNVASNPLVVGSADSADGVTPASLFKLANDWPALKQIIQLLGPGGLGVGAAGDGTQTVPISALPQLSLSSAGASTLQPNQFASGIFLFIAALRSGNFQNFLGEKNIQTLTKAGYSNLLNQANAEFSQLAKLANDAPGQWQTLFFPVAVNGEVEMVRWFTKRDQQSKQEEEARVQSTRFIVELNTSVLGELQLDGLYRYETERNKLELVLRSHSPLDSDIHQAIMEIVQEVNDTTGLNGSITFQPLAQFPEHPLEEALRDVPDVMA